MGRILVERIGISILFGLELLALEIVLYYMFVVYFNLIR